MLKAKKSLLAPLYEKVCNCTDSQLRSLLDEDPATAQRRQLLVSRLALLKKAKGEIEATVGSTVVM